MRTCCCSSDSFFWSRSVSRVSKSRSSSPPKSRRASPPPPPPPPPLADWRFLLSVMPPCSPDVSEHPRSVAYRCALALWNPDSDGGNASVGGASAASAAAKSAIALCSHCCVSSRGGYRPPKDEGSTVSPAAARRAACHAQRTIPSHGTVGAHTPPHRHCMGVHDERACVHVYSVMNARASTCTV